ncbi:MAG: RES family NAD+ phosphorylase [Anaerolineae bacterium]|nr:RES family NAD+ phosphorylase [Gemmatimonadaceae bacterium]
MRRVTWRPCIRIVPSRFPPVSLFERVADPDDVEAVIAVESLTNERLRQEAGEIALVAPEDRVSGAGSSYIMAPFTHRAPGGSRFSDGTFGVYYAARDEETAIAETRYHRERFMRATEQPRMELDMRVITATLDGLLHDLRGRRAMLPAIYHLDNYAAPSALGRELRAAGSMGIAYDSVRYDGGQCAAVLRPRVLSRCRQTRHLSYLWDGERITYVYEKRLRE